MSDFETMDYDGNQMSDFKTIKIQELRHLPVVVLRPPQPTQYSLQQELYKKNIYLEIFRMKL